MGADMLLVIEVLAIVTGLGVLTVALLALLDAAAEAMRLRLLRRRELRRRFGKELRSRPGHQDIQELTLEDTQELTPVQSPRRRGMAQGS
jgi:hypothetical protein